MKQIAFFLIAMFSAMFVSSCSDDKNAEQRVEFARIVESRTAQDLLNDLYLGSDGDIEAMARIMKVTPSSIKRLKQGETEPTAEFEERIREVSLFYMQNGQSFTKLQSIADPAYAWYDSILNFPSHYPWWFWSINIILFLTLAFAAIVVIFPLLGELLIFFIAWIASLICSPAPPVQDSYVESINPVIEQIR